MRNRFLVALGLAAAITIGATAQTQPAPLRQSSGQAPRQTAINLQDTMPFDPAVRTGTLPNGLKFFVRQNASRPSASSLRLAVKAGSLDEADDQQGLAHLIEHMAFNGSAHFKPGELVSYFESIGARLGPHVNAYTSFDETVYMLDLPTDKPEVVAKGLTALADFAGGLTLDAEGDRQGARRRHRGMARRPRRRIAHPRQAVPGPLPQVALRRAAADRQARDPAHRAAPARLRAFYDTWYRPELMAVVAVGDIDAPSTMEQAIKTAFAPLKARAPAAPEPDRTVPLHQQPLISIVTDPEVTQIERVDRAQAAA